MTIAYRPEIDGLRAISILSVLLFHLKVPGFGGGYVGVDIFFVISGYLITRNIISDLETGRFTYYQFYTRRIRRLFPASYFIILVSFVAGCILLSPEDLHDFARTVLAAFAAISNVAFWRQAHAYFLANNDYIPLLHNWSLSLEEQFYLVCPALLILAARFGWLGKAGVGFTIAGLVSLLACEIWRSHDPSAVFYLPQFRIFEFAIGALCIDAEKRRLKSVLALQIIVILGLVAIAISIFTFNNNTPFPGIAGLLPCLGAAFIIYAGSVPYVSAVLTNRLAVGIGLISYSLYLCHWPIIVFARYAIGEVSSVHGKALLIGLSLIAAIAMYRFVEKPFRGSQAPVTLAGFGKLTAACVALSLLLVVPAAFADRQKGWSWRLTDAQREVRDKHRYGGAVCVEDGASQCAFGDLRSPLGVFLVGDSYMEHLIPAFISVAQQFQMRGEVLALGGCTMLLGLQAVLPNGDISSTCRRFRDQTIGKLRSNDIPVVISLRWKTTALADDDGNSLEGQPANIRIEAWRQAIERTIATLGLNRKYLLIGSQVQFSCIVGREQFYIGPMSSGGVDGICNDLPAATARSENAAVNGMLRAVQKAHPEQVTLLFPEDYICSESRCIFEWNGRLLYHDSSHFTVAGAEYIGARADKELQNFFLSAAPAAKRPGQ